MFERYEMRDVRTRWIAWGAVATLFAGICVHLMLSLFFRHLSGAWPSANRAQITTPQKEPRLMESLTGDRAEFEKRAQAALHGYAWEDRASGQVRIPIERAMERMLDE